MSDYEIRRIPAGQLEEALERLSGSDWELVTVVPASENIEEPLTGQYFLIIMKRRKTS